MKKCDSKKIFEEFKKHLEKEQVCETIKALMHHSGVATAQAQLRKDRDDWKEYAQQMEQQIKRMTCADIDTSDPAQAHEEIKQRLLNAFNMHNDDDETLSAMSTLILNNRLSQ